MHQKTADGTLHELTVAIQGVVDSVAAAHDAAGTPRVELSRPADENFGDFATNVALLLAPVVRSNPRAIAQEIVDGCGSIEGIQKIEVAGPGFINITLTDDWFRTTLEFVLAAGNTYGSNVVPVRERLLVEYVSANPTGPLVVVSARHAAFGDSLARVLAYAGHDVATEYYINDTGRQVDLFGASIVARARGEQPPEGGYEGEYVSEIAEEFAVQADADATAVGRAAVDMMVARAKPALESYRAHFDRFQRESELHDDGTVARAIERVRDTGQVYELDGALFLRTTAYGDDKDRAIVRSNGVPTYFAADIGYMLNKFARGYDTMLYVLGADHHGYIARLKAAAVALGYSAERCEIVIMQMVHLVDGDEVRKMSKRRGDIVPIEELIDRIGIDAARYFLIQRSHDQSLEIDLALAAEQNAKNPVYYVQYAHARICSIARKVANEIGLQNDDPVAAVHARPDDLHGAERRLVKRLAEFPVVIADVAQRRAPHRLTTYAQDLASDFALMYRDCRVVGDGIDEATTLGRLSLCTATQVVLARTLDLIGVSAPESM